MAGVEYPTQDSCPIDQVRVCELALEVLPAYLEHLSKVDTATKKREVFRLTANGWGGVTTAAPDYRSELVHEQLVTFCALPVARPLVEYLWSRGALKGTFGVDGDAIPPREMWDRYAWKAVFYEIIQELLERAAVEDLVRSGVASPWKLDDLHIAEVVKDHISRLFGSARTVVGWCPIDNVHSFPRTGCALASGIELLHWSDIEQCIFLTRNKAEYHLDEHSHVFSNTILKITASSATEEGAVKSVADAIDRVKWAFMAVSKSATPLCESAVVLRGASGYRVPTLRRGFAYESDGRGIILDSSLLSRTKDLLHELQEARIRWPELDSVLWLFGRSCNARLPRDVLLDAVVGLEMLLVAGGPGDISYRFALHGVAVIPNEQPTKLHDDLKEVYRMRSGAAHGSAARDADLAGNAERARVLLAKAILGVVRLSSANKLDSIGGKPKLARAIELLVRSRVRI